MSFIQQHSTFLIMLALFAASLFAVPILREAYRLLRAARVRVRSRAARAAIDALTAVTAAAVAGAAEEVRNLKDPSRPGAWTRDTAARIRERVIEEVLSLGGAFVRELTALGVVDAGSVYGLIEKLVEEQVERLRRLGPVVTELRVEDLAEVAAPLAPAAKVLSPYRGSTIVTPSAPPPPPSAPSVDLSRASVAPAPHGGRAGSQGGFARLTALALVLFVILTPALLAIVGCGPARETVMRAAPGVPDPEECAPGAWRCRGEVPEYCSDSHRFWPSLARNADGSQRVCRAGCAINDAGVGVCLPSSSPEGDVR